MRARVFIVPWLRRDRSRPSASPRQSPPRARALVPVLRADGDVGCGSHARARGPSAEPDQVDVRVAPPSLLPHPPPARASSRPPAHVRVFPPNPPPPAARPQLQPEAGGLRRAQGIQRLPGDRGGHHLQPVRGERRARDGGARGCLPPRERRRDRAPEPAKRRGGGAPSRRRPRRDGPLRPGPDLGRVGAEAHVRGLRPRGHPRRDANRRRRGRGDPPAPGSSAGPPPETSATDPGGITPKPRSSPSRRRSPRRSPRGRCRRGGTGGTRTTRGGTTRRIPPRDARGGTPPSRARAASTSERSRGEGRGKRRARACRARRRLHDVVAVSGGDYQYLSSLYSRGGGSLDYRSEGVRRGGGWSSSL